MTRSSIQQLLYYTLNKKNSHQEVRVSKYCAGGEREIRTPGGRKPSTVFKTAAINRSAISPRFAKLLVAQEIKASQLLFSAIKTADFQLG